MQVTAGQGCQENPSTLRPSQEVETISISILEAQRRTHAWEGRETIRLGDTNSHLLRVSATNAGQEGPPGERTPLTQPSSISADPRKQLVSIPPWAEGTGERTAPPAEQKILVDDPGSLFLLEIQIQV